MNEFCFMEFGRYEVIMTGFGGFQPMRAVFDGRYKLSLNLLSQDEFYDLQEDPLEMVNESMIRPAMNGSAACMTRILDHMNRTRDPFPRLLLAPPPRGERTLPMRRGAIPAIPASRKMIMRNVSWIMRPV